MHQVLAARPSDPPAFRAEVFDGPAVQILRCRGELDLTSAEDLTAIVRGLAGRFLVIDLTALTFLDSMGISALVAAHRRYPRRRLAICCPPGAPRRALQVGGLDDLFIVTDTLAAATSALG